MTKHNTYLILDNIRSSENVGAIFRTAEAVSVSKIFLVGITPAPIDRFGRVQPKIKKIALGAEESVEWEQYEDIKTLIKDLKRQKVKIIAVEQNENSKDYKNVLIEGDTAFIFGGEVSGIDKITLSLCDSIVEIPMRGKKESLNVSVSVGVALYRILGV